jgi:hypothetical protein
MTVTTPPLYQKHDIEKVHMEKVVVEIQRTSGMTAEDAEFLLSFPEDKRKAVLRKVDVCFDTLLQ